MSNVSKINGYDIKDSTARTNLAEITSLVELMNSKKSLFIGDSYMYGIIPGGSTTPFTTTLKDRLNLSNDDIYIYSMPGAGFKGKSETYQKDFRDLINDSINEISATDKQLIKYIYILGGYNDRGSTSSNIQLEMQSLSTLLKTNYPNATIYVGMLGNDSNISVDGRVARYNLFLNSLQAYKKCTQYGMVYLNGSEYLMKEYNLFASDGIHPNQNGQDKIGNALFNIIKTGYYYHKDGLFSITFANPNFSGTFTAYLILNNNLVHFRFDSSTITLTNNVTNNPNNGINIDLGETDLRYIRNVFNRSLGNTPVRLFDTNNNYYDFTAQVLYDDTGHLKLYILTDLSSTTIQFNKVQFIENNFNINLVNC